MNPPNFGIAPGIVNLTVTFDPNNKIAGTAGDDNDPVDTLTNYYLLARDRNGAFGGKKIHPTAASFDNRQNSVTLTFDPTKIPANLYQLNILANIVDVFGNQVYFKLLNSITSDFPYVETVRLSGMDTGVYFLVVTAGGVSKIERFIKLRR